MNEFGGDREVPGDKITDQNIDKVKDLISPGMEWALKHGWPMTIGETKRIDLRRGHVVSRPPGTKIAHSFCGGPGGGTMLIYGTRKPNDMCWYPRSNKVFFRGLGVIARLELLGYGDGEPAEGRSSHL